MASFYNKLEDLCIKRSLDYVFGLAKNISSLKMPSKESISVGVTGILGSVYCFKIFEFKKAVFVLSKSVLGYKFANSMSFNINELSKSFEIERKDKQKLLQRLEETKANNKKLQTTKVKLLEKNNKSITKLQNKITKHEELLCKSNVMVLDQVKLLQDKKQKLDNINNTKMILCNTQLMRYTAFKPFYTPEKKRTLALCNEDSSNIFSTELGKRKNSDNSFSNDNFNSSDEEPASEIFLDLKNNMKEIKNYVDIHKKKLNQICHQQQDIIIEPIAEEKGFLYSISELIKNISSLISNNYFSICGGSFLGAAGIYIYDHYANDALCITVNGIACFKLLNDICE